MRVMVMMKGTDAIEAGVQPSEALIRDMMTFNEELAAAGMLLAGEGLQPSSKGKRVVFGGRDTPIVIDGPFAEVKELIAGFWIWQVKDMDEAVAWARRIPDTDKLHGEVEIRPILSTEDFEAITPDIVAREEALRDQAGRYGEA
ncbi:YciI family protein [Brevundimonas sp. 2YAF1]|uniref:YciI family protein n=1 Tax=Brevundimonas sp. 2YAF1 TaxID=3233024 RepID=UPI003F92F398